MKFTVFIPSIHQLKVAAALGCFLCVSSFAERAQSKKSGGVPVVGGLLEQRNALAKSSPSQWSDADLKEKVATDLHAIGSLSVGLPNNGRLLNGIRPEEGKLFEIVAPNFAWGTEETIQFLQVATQAVHKKHPDTAPLHIGHLSKKTGGYLSPHLSHQSGRDVDIGYYYTKKRTWYRRATWQNLDTARTWTLVRSLITDTDVEMILIDRSLQSLLKKHALKIGEDKNWLHRVFKGSKKRPAIVRHVRGHATHIHVRFFSPHAQGNAQRAYPFLLENELVKPVVVFAHHRVRKGETLGRLARRYGTSVRAIQRANGLRGTTIQARRTYKIPRRGGPLPTTGKLVFHDRQLP